MDHTFEIMTIASVTSEKKKLPLQNNKDPNNKWHELKGKDLDVFHFKWIVLNSAKLKKSKPWETFYI